jgi:chromate transporter
MTTAEHSRPSVPFSATLAVWIKIGLLSFGGPTGQIALMHRELVERRRWISDSRFLHALNFCMILPGPEAQQLAIYTGWLLQRTLGAVIAGVLFVLPGAMLIGAIAYAYMAFGDVPVMEAIFYGLKSAVLAVVAAAVIRMGVKILRNAVLWVIAACAFVGIFFLNLPFPLIVLSALAFGFVGSTLRPQWFGANGGHGSQGETGTKEDGDYLISDTTAVAARPATGKTIRTVVVWTLIWTAPLLVALVFLGRGHLLTEQALFFARAALVTFGGAYAVLPYVAQQAVETHGWITATQMVDGLGLAETTPGPLILVLQFVGFVGGWQNPGALSPLVMALLAASITTWRTFVPGFLFILAGAPYVESTRGHLRLKTALTAVTAAVIGIVLNLAVWFGWHVFWIEDTGLDYLSLVLAIAFFFLIQKWKIDVLWVVLTGAACGLILHLGVLPLFAA